MDDLERLGHALTLATTRAVARRERRRRTLSCALAALLVFAAMTPTHLGSADHPDFFALAIDSAGAAVRCDQPRGQRFHYTDACIERHPAPQAAR